MWRWKENGSAANHTATSVIDQGCEVEGRLAFVGTLAVNGKVRGELFSSDTLIIGETGVLQADIQVGTAIVSGQVSGNIIGRERVELRRNARVSGDIITPVLILEEGVIFDGHCKMQGESASTVEKTP